MGNFDWCGVHAEVRRSIPWGVAMDPDGFLDRCCFGGGDGHARKAREGKESAETGALVALVSAWCGSREQSWRRQPSRAPAVVFVARRA